MTYEFLVSLFIVFLMCMGVTAYWAYNIAKYHHRQEQIKNVKDYLDHTIPNEWTAYKKGVNEGYEQGLRDGQDQLE